MKFNRLFTPGVAISLVAILCIAVLIGVILKGFDLFFKPTYTLEEIPSAIIEICAKECKLKEPVEVAIAGKTLGARITAEFKTKKGKKNERKAKKILNRIIKICKIDLNSTSNNPSWLKLHQPAIEEGFVLREDLRKAMGEPCLSEETQKLTMNFSQAVRRVCMSTDAPIDFRNIIFRDSITKQEIGRMAYLEDIIKAQAGWTSWVDFSYFRDIGEKRLASYKSKYDEAVKLLLLAQSLTEKETAELTELKSISTSPDQRLYYIKMEKGLGESKSIDEFFLLVPEIEIYPMDKLPPNLQKYNNISEWKDDELFIEDISFQEFFTRQISQIIEDILGFVEDIKGAYINLYPEKQGEINLYIPEITVTAELLTKNGLDPDTKLSELSQNTLKLTFKPEVSDGIALEKLLNLSLWVVKNRCEAYGLYDFSSLEIFNGNEKIVLNVDKQELFKRAPVTHILTPPPAEPLLFQR